VHNPQRVVLSLCPAALIAKCVLSSCCCRSRACRDPAADSPISTHAPNHHSPTASEYCSGVISRAAPPVREVAGLLYMRGSFTPPDPPTPAAPLPPPRAEALQGLPLAVPGLPLAVPGREADMEARRCAPAACNPCTPAAEGGRGPPLLLPGLLKLLLVPLPLLPACSNCCWVRKGVAEPVVDVTGLSPPAKAVLLLRPLRDAGRPKTGTSLVMPTLRLNASISSTVGTRVARSMPDSSCSRSSLPAGCRASRGVLNRGLCMILIGPNWSHPTSVNVSTVHRWDLARHFAFYPTGAQVLHALLPIASHPTTTCCHLVPSPH
jgi:hypothetical protein